MLYHFRSHKISFSRGVAFFLTIVICSLRAYSQLPGVQWGVYYDAEQIIPQNFFQADEELVDQIAVDTTGGQDYIYIVGRTLSINKNSAGKSWKTAACIGDTITTGQKTPAAFLAKYNSSGTLLWSQFIGTDQPYPYFYTTYGNCITVDHLNGQTLVYVGGEITNGLSAGFNAFSCGTSCSDPVYDTQPDDNDEGFIAKYDGEGNLLRWTYVGGSVAAANSIDQVLSITVHPVTHDVYATGYTESSNFGSSGQQSGIPYYDNTLAGKGDIFIASFNSCLQMTWFTYYGGAGIQNQQKQNQGQERGHSIKIFHSSTDDFFVVSCTVESNGLAVSANYDHTYGGVTTANEDAFLMRWNISNLSSGPAWANYLGGDSPDRGRCIDLDSDGNIYWTGRTSSTGLAYPSSCSANLAQATKGAKEDAFIAKFSKGGKARWITYFGGNGDESVNGIEYYAPPCSPAIVIISGLTSSTDLPHIPSTYPHATLNGNNSTKYNDAFIAAVEDRDVCSTAQGIKFSTYLGGSSDEINHSSLSYGPFVQIGRSMYVSFSTKSKNSQMLDGADSVLGTFNLGCCGGVSNTEAFLEKFYPFDLCRQTSEESSAQASSVLKCYPSPFTSKFICRILSESDENTVISIIDVYGNEVEKKPVALTERVNEFSFDLTSWPPGVYFIKTELNDEIHVSKIVKQE